MSGVLITHSYFLHLDPKMQRLMTPYPPLGTLIAAEYLADRAYPVACFDTMFTRGPSEFVASLESHHPDLCVIYDDDFNYLTKMCLSNMRYAAFEMIRAAVSRNVPVLVHGSDATDHANAYLQQGALAVIVGEGEQTLLEATDALLIGYKNRLNDIPGLVRTNTRTPKRDFFENMDELPDPDFDRIDIERYRDAWQKKHGYFSLNVSTTRGCPYHCNWCAKPIYGQSYHSYSPQKVARHWQILKERFRPDHLWITDDIFGLKPGWLESFQHECSRSGAMIPYKCQTRADLLLRDRMIDNLKTTGCVDIWIGAESGSQKVLDAMEKGIRVEHIYEATRQVKKAGMNISFFIQFGYPGENWKDICETRKLIKDNLPAELGISVSYPLPGTKFYERVKHDLKTKSNWTDSDDLDMMFAGTYPRHLYKSLQRFVHSEYRVTKFFRERSWGKLIHLIYHILRLYCYRLIMTSHIKTNN
jgi:radical SAM superfamily enzyme YgiQ (UPF0313 family)